jgi:methyl-accepting chemotaxis protein
MVFHKKSKVQELENKKEKKKKELKVSKKKEKIKKREREVTKESAKKETKKIARKIIYRVSLRVQVLVGFMIPIILIIVLGSRVYTTAKDGLIDNYKQGAVQSLQISSELLDNELSHIEQIVMDLYLNEDIYYYCSGIYNAGDYESVQMVNEIRDNIIMKMADPSIANIYIIPNNEVKTLSTRGSTGDAATDLDIFSRIKEDIEQIVFSEEDQFGWSGTHTKIDEIWEQDNSEYILSCYMYHRNKKGLLVVDLKSSLIQEIIETIALPEGASISFITKDGRELNTGDASIAGFVNEPFYQEAVTSNSSEGSSMVEFQGQTYLFMYHMGNVTGSMVAELVPESVIMERANEIRRFVMATVVIAIIIVSVIGMVIALDLEKKLNRLQKVLGKIAEGDLTVQVEGEGKTAFGKVNRDMTETISGVKQLIAKVKTVAMQVSERVEEVEHATKNISKSATDINLSIDEINQGTNQQANDAADCLTKMDELSHRILTTSSSVDEVTRIADDTINRIKTGSENMEQLVNKSKETGKLSEEVGEKVATLAERSIQIESFVSQIEEIADQTNLLSLNASIEAARAGDAGRGFAVVANEIQKLSENSLEASRKIAEVVKTILEMTDEAKNSTEKAVHSIEEQQVNVSETGENFKEMNAAILLLLEKLKDVSIEIDKMQTERKDTLSGIENISSVLEETAAVSENVGMNATSQKELTEKLQQITDELQESTDVLMKEIRIFTVE